MRILFLDIDGVLNRGHLDVAAESTTLDPAAVTRLNGILRDGAAQVVVSSSWRYLILGGAMTPDGFEYLLRTHGLVKGCIVGHTCPDEEVFGRGAQIRAWVAEHGPLEAWAVLDDIEMDLGDDRWRHVRPDPATGLTDADAAAVVRILRGAGPVSSTGA
jgi:hypothetical protein